MNDELSDTEIDSPLSLTCRELPSAILIEVVGELDMATAPQLQSCLADETATHPTHLVLDLSGVCFIASSGLTVLVGAHKNLGAVNGTLHLVGVTDNRAVERVLTVSGLHQVLRIHPDLDVLLALLEAA